MEGSFVCGIVVGSDHPTALRQNALRTRGTKELLPLQKVELTIVYLRVERERGRNQICDLASQLWDGKRRFWVLWHLEVSRIPRDLKWIVNLRKHKIELELNSWQKRGFYVIGDVLFLLAEGPV